MANPNFSKACAKEIRGWAFVTFVVDKPKCLLSSVLILKLLLVLLSGCASSEINTSVDEVRYHEGTVFVDSVLLNGLLEVEIWRITYTDFQTTTSEKGTFFRIPNAAVYLKFHNHGTRPITVERVSSSDASSVAFYLIDQVGTRYPAKSRGWSMSSEALDEAGGYVIVPSDDPRIPEQHLLPNDGIVQPGETIESILEFGGIPRTATALTLVMEGIKNDEGKILRIETEIPLPQAGDS